MEGMNIHTMETQMLQITTFFFPKSWFLNVYQHTFGLTATQVVELCLASCSRGLRLSCSLKPKIALSDQVLNSKTQL